MADNRSDLPSNLGQTLAELRNAAGLNQVDIETANKQRCPSLTQSRISRIENGIAHPNEQEIEAYLSAIDTEEAEEYRAFLKQSWKNLQRPSFRNPQRKDLWKAETCLENLEKLIAEGVPDYLRPEAEMNKKRVREEAEYLTSLKHSIAYVGRIGVGKTTAISQLTGLVIPKETSFLDRSALSVGSSRTTVCEVGIRVGEKHGIRITPQTPEEIDNLVEELCTSKKLDKEDKDNLTSEIPKEIRRLLLNMARLNPREKDPLSELSDSCPTPEELVLQVKERLKLDDRTREEIWFEEKKSTQSAIHWLKDTFKEINYGNHPEFTIPKRIDVIVPDNFFDNSNYKLEVIDTRGIDNDGTVLRPDLMDCFNNPRTLTVLCSRFNDAPDRQIYDLIGNLIEKGSEKVLRERTIILCLPRNDEDREITDPQTGDRVDSKEEGYSLKLTEIHDVIKPLLKNIQVTDIPVLFFNAKLMEHELKELSDNLLHKIEGVRAASLHRLVSAVEAIENLIKNQKEQNAKEAYEKVGRALNNFLAEYQNKQLSVSQVHHKLLREMKKTHPRTIRATIKRMGIYSDKFDMYFILGEGTRSVAWNQTFHIFYEFQGRIKSLKGDNPIVHEYADSFLTEILSNWEIWYEEFLKYTQHLGEQTFKATRLSSWLLWQECTEITGSEYRDEVIGRLTEWFALPEQKELQNRLSSQVNRAWQEKVLAQLDKLTDGIASDTTA